MSFQTHKFFFISRIGSSLKKRFTQNRLCSRFSICPRLSVSSHVIPPPIIDFTIQMIICDQIAKCRFYGCFCMFCCSWVTLRLAYAQTAWRWSSPECQHFSLRVVIRETDISTKLCGSTSSETQSNNCYPPPNEVEHFHKRFLVTKARWKPKLCPTGHDQQGGGILPANCDRD